jgi:hypothetical protein
MFGMLYLTADIRIGDVVYTATDRIRANRTGVPPLHPPGPDRIAGVARSLLDLYRPWRLTAAGPGRSATASAAPNVGAKARAADERRAC